MEKYTNRQNQIYGFQKENLEKFKKEDPKRAVLDSLMQTNIESAIEKASEVQIDRDIQNAAWEFLSHNPYERNSDHFGKFIETFELTEEDVQLAGEKALEFNMLFSVDLNLRSAEDIIKNFKLNEDAVKLIVKKGIIKFLKEGDSSFAIKTINRIFSFHDGPIYDRKYLIQAKYKARKRRHKDEAEKIKIENYFDFFDETMKEPARICFLNKLRLGRVDLAVEMKEVFSVEYENSDEEVNLAAKEGFSCNLRNGGGNELRLATQILSVFKLPKESVREIVVDNFIYHLKNKDIEAAMRIKDSFNVNLNYEEFCAFFPGLKNIIEAIEFSVGGSNIDFRNENILIHLTQFSDNPEDFIEKIRQNPFLFGALIENEQHGIKLLLKFNEFDDIAQQDIQKLYEIKAKIKNQQPDLDPNSNEFRMLMQKNLIGFANNKKILVEIGRSGIDIRQWLTYSTERYFDLGKEDETLFSEQIQSPIKRIDEAIGIYLAQVSSVLTPYKTELNNAEIPSDKKAELTGKLEKMQLQIIEAQQNGNNEKVEGIQKGVANLESQIAQLKPATIWNKLIGDLNNVEILGSELSKSYDDLCALEEEQKNAGADRKKQIELKEKIKQQELKIKAKIVNLDEKFTNFQKTISNLLTNVLGDERAEAMTQEITEATGMEFDHYREDLSTIQNLFKQETTSLEKTPMRISIAPRNPDSDLYLGNDCPCCIRIDSDIHGAECPIADFVTDLGMHNIVIYDEKKGKPVAVAWCFMGKNKKSEQPILVVDNTEANTDYSIKFKAQLEKELSFYIKDFAEKCGVKDVKQGPHNNDLKVAKFSEVDEKLGGTNRATGYYLEAERDE